MALNIKNEEAHQLATRLAAVTGTTMTEAVTTAVRETLARRTIAPDAFLERLGVSVRAFDGDAARLARLGYARFGKGVGDPGVLNLGDCFSYGTAMALRHPLLFTGDDFARTDVEPASY